MKKEHSTRARVAGALLAALALVGCASTDSAARDWRELLTERLPVLGHRNFVVVADAAFPEQSSPGIETVYTGVGQLEALDEVLRAVDEAAHVSPIVYLDAELVAVAEADAPGVTAYRQALERALEGRAVRRLQHMEIIRELDSASELFTVLILKTDMTLPYTSVFVELDCGYWGAEREERLRAALSER